MTPNTEKAADSRLRSLALRNGYCLRKSRARRGIDNHGQYRIVDPDLNNIVAGERFDMDPQDVENWLDTHGQGRLAGRLNQ